MQLTTTQINALANGNSDAARRLRELGDHRVTLRLRERDALVRHDTAVREQQAATQDHDALEARAVALNPT